MQNAKLDESQTGIDSIKTSTKKQRHHFADKGPYSQSYDFFSSHIRMWELDHKEDWEPKNPCFWNMMMEKALVSPLDSRRQNQSSLKEINLDIAWKDGCWSWSSNTLANWQENLT